MFLVLALLTRPALLRVISSDDITATPSLPGGGEATPSLPQDETTEQADRDDATSKATPPSHLTTGQLAVLGVWLCVLLLALLITMQLLLCLRLHRKRRVSITRDSAHHKKFSVVVHGIAECAHGTPIEHRITQDANSAASAITHVVGHTHHQFSEVRRLGRYERELPRPRPLLVTLLRCADVCTILSHRDKLKPPLHVQPYMSMEELTHKHTCPWRN